MLLNKQIPITYILNKVKYDLFYVLIVSFLIMFITESKTGICSNDTAGIVQNVVCIGDKF